MEISVAHNIDKYYKNSNHASTSFSTGSSALLSTGLGNVLAVVSDRKLLVCIEYNKFEDFEGSPNVTGAWNIRDSWSGLPHHVLKI